MLMLNYCYRIFFDDRFSVKFDIYLDPFGTREERKSKDVNEKYFYWQILG